MLTPKTAKYDEQEIEAIETLLYHDRFKTYTDIARLGLAMVYERYGSAALYIREAHEAAAHAVQVRQEVDGE